MNPSRKPVLFLALGIVVALVTLLLITSSSQRKKEEERIPADRRAFTTLSVVASKNQVTVGEQFTIEVRIASGENRINGVQLELQYDPTVIAIENVSEGDFLPKPILLNNANNKAEGFILFALGSIDGKKGNGAVAKLTARAQKRTRGQTELLTIRPTSLITEFDNKNSVLKEVKGATIVIR